MNIKHHKSIISVAALAIINEYFETPRNLVPLAPKTTEVVINHVLDEMLLGTDYELDANSELHLGYADLDVTGFNVHMSRRLEATVDKFEKDYAYADDLYEQLKLIAERKYDPKYGGVLHIVDVSEYPISAPMHRLPVAGFEAILKHTRADYTIPIYDQMNPTEIPSYLTVISQMEAITFDDNDAITIKAFKEYLNYTKAEVRRFATSVNAEITKAKAANSLFVAINGNAYAIEVIHDAITADSLPAFVAYVDHGGKVLGNQPDEYYTKTIPSKGNSLIVEANHAQFHKNREEIIETINGLANFNIEQKRQAISLYIKSKGIEEVVKHLVFSSPANQLYIELHEKYESLVPSDPRTVSFIAYLVHVLVKTHAQQV